MTKINYIRWVWLKAILKSMIDTSMMDIFQFKVIAKVRNSSKLTSSKIVEELPKKVPPGHSVSLTSPDLIILVTVFKVRSFLLSAYWSYYCTCCTFTTHFVFQSVAGISVLPRYAELRKYNVTQLVEARDLEMGQGAASRMSVLSAAQASTRGEGVVPPDIGVRGGNNKISEGSNVD